MKPKLAICQELTKNANAAHLLYRIAYWTPKMEAKGKRWIANSAREWCDQTALSYDQYRRAIRLLRDEELVETEQHLFRSKNVTHVRLTAKARSALGLPQVKKGNVAQIGDGETAQHEMSDFAQLHIQEDTFTEILQQKQTKTGAAAPVNTGTASENLKKDTGKEKQYSINEPDLKYENEVQENQNKKCQHHKKLQHADAPSGAPGDVQISSKPSSYHAHSQNACVPLQIDLVGQQTAGLTPAADPETPAGLAAVWAQIIHEEYKDFVPPPKQKELKQLQLFIGLCPDGQSGAILEQCLRAWVDFINVAKSEYGAYSIPYRPTFDFLLKYSTAAINFGLEALKKSAEKQAKTKAKFPSPPTLEADDPYAGLDEGQIIKMMNGEPDMKVCHDEADDPHPAADCHKVPATPEEAEKKPTAEEFLALKFDDLDAGEDGQ